METKTKTVKTTKPELAKELAQNIITKDEVKSIKTKVTKYNNNAKKALELQKANRDLSKDIFSLALNLIADKQASDKTFAKASKKVVAKTLRLQGLQHKSVSIALSVIELGLTLDKSLSVTTIQKVVTYINSKQLSKSKANKLNKEELIAEIKKLDKAKRIASAKKLLGTK